MDAGPRLEFRLLGRFAVLRDGQEVPAAAFGGRKARTLLRILATRRGELISNDALTEMLWPDRAPSDPAANLHVLVTRARKAIGDTDAIRTGTGGYALDERCSVDAEAFLAAVGAAAGQEPGAAFATLRAAARTWGEPLAEDAYADWAVDYRDRLFTAHQHAVEQTARIALDRGDFRVAIEDASAAASAQPLREAAVLTLIRAIAGSGEPADALKRYEMYRRQLADELGIDPSPQAQALYRQLLHPGLHGARRGGARPEPVVFRELPFVGRRREVDAIAALLDEQAGGGTVIVSGPSGAGKSRLLDAVTARVPAVAARAYVPEREHAWSLIRTLLREVFDQDVTYLDGLPPPLAAAARSLLPESAEDGDPAGRADTESLRALRQEAVTRVLGSLHHAVVVDDLQWADPTSAAVLELARARLPTLRLLLAFRPEEIAGSEAAAGLVHRVDAGLAVRLDALAPKAIDELVADPALRDALVANTDCSPMAIREVLRALAAAELIITPGPEQRWRPVDDAAVPRATELGRQGQRRAIAARAEQLSPDDREVLETICSHAGEIHTGMLGAATGLTEAELADRLARLHRAGLVRLGELGWTTTHDMVGEAVVGQLDDASLAHRHAQLAAASQRDGRDPAETARHWLAAGDRTKATRAYATAAQRALDSFADAEAVAAADAGLALRPDAPELLEVRAQARSRRGELGGARADLRQALQHCDAGPPRARLLGRLAMLASGSDDMVRAAELVESAVVEAGEDDAARASALEIAAIIDMNLGLHDRASQRSVSALELYRRLGDARGTARVLDARAMATFLGGDVREGQRALTRAADLFEDSGDLVHVMTPRSTAGHAAVFAGDAEAGLGAATAALEIARTLGHPEGQAYALWHRAEALSALHRPGEAMRDAKDALETATGLGHRGWTATSWRAIGIAAQAAGDLAAALAAFEQSLQCSEHLDLFASWAAARAAIVLVELGDRDRARPMVARALAQGPQLARYESALAEVALAAACGDVAAPELAREAIALFERGGVRQGLEQLASV